MAVRNGERFVGEALRSMLGQSAPPEEIVVVDDGSTDGTVERVRAAAPTARILRGDGRGPAAARNAGIRAARGSFIAFLDHDDRWTPRRLERHARLLADRADADAVLGSTRFERLDPGGGSFVPAGDPFPAMSLGALLARRSLFDRVGLLDESRDLCEDVEWFARARARGAAILLDDEIAQVARRHDANRTSDARADRRAFFDALRTAARARRPEIAVILSVRDGARFIGDALRSIAAQTLEPAEVAVVDGRSRDGTREIVAGHAFARLIDREPRGVADANNAGIAATRAPLVAFLSHDDRWAPDKLERQAARLAEDPSLDFVVGLAAFECAPGCVPPPGFRRELLDGPVPAYILETLLVRRELLDRVGPFDPSLRSAEDVDWFARAFHLGARGAVIDRVVVHKRVHDRNTSLDAAANTARLLRVVRGAVRRAHDAAPAPGGAA